MTYRGVGAIVALFLTGGSALTEGFPIRAKEGRVAPYGYNRSGDFYVPSSRNARPALLKRDGEVCPHGYSPSGGACVSTR